MNDLDEIDKTSKHYLITGGVGFIGFHLAHALLKRGDKVTIIDNFCDAPYPTWMKKRNAKDLSSEFDVCIQQGSITDPSFIDTTFAANSFHAVIHLAALAGVRPSFKSPSDYAKVNVEGTMRVIEAAGKANIKRMVMASSSSVYGDSTPLPAIENAASILPESPYAASKRASELFASSYSKSMPDLRITALRFFTVYGPRQRPEMAITLFAKAMLLKQPITMFGDGSMRRDFTHVDDIVRGILLAEKHMPQGYSVYNLGSGSPVDLHALIQALSKATNTAPKLAYAPKPLGDVTATYASIDKAERQLFWKPEVSLEKGLESVVEWARLELNSEKSE